MIVKNKNPAIRGCLNSVKDLIDYWVIVDTGSVDGTKEVIKDFLREIPGELHEREWVGFAHHRREAWDASRGKADYILIIDADDRLVFFEDFVVPELEEEVYGIIRREQTGDFFKENYSLLFVKNDKDFEWKGIEFLRCKEPKMVRILSHVIKDQTC